MAYKIIFYGCILLPVAIITILSGGDPGRLINFYPDDAFYYLQTAYIYSKNNIVSFDGVNVTTGFHPLQMILSIIGAKFFSKEHLIVVFFWLNPIFYSVSMSLLLRKLDYKGKDFCFATLATLATFTIHIFAASGMESGLVLFFSAALFCSLYDIESRSEITYRDLGFIGTIAGLLSMSRLDMIIPMAIVLLPLLVRLLIGRRWLALLVLAGTYILVVSPYFVWMISVQGDFMPVSSLAKYGRQKATFSSVFTTLTGNSFIGVFILLLCVVLPIAVVMEGVFRPKGGRVISNLTFPLSSLAYLVYIFTIAHEPYRWYLTYPLLVAVTSLLVLIKNSSCVHFSHKRKLVFVIPACVFIFNSAVFLRYYSYETVSSSLYSMVMKINDIIPQGSNIAIHDAGIVGYFSNSNVHNLDGLINSKANLETYLKSGNVLGYAKKYGINYLILREDIYHSLQNSSSEMVHKKITHFDVTRMSREYLIELR